MGSGINDWSPGQSNRNTFKPVRPNADQCLKLDRDGIRCTRLEYARGVCHSHYTSWQHSVKQGRKTWAQLEALGQAKPSIERFGNSCKAPHDKSNRPKMEVKYQSFLGMGLPPKPTTKPTKTRKGKKSA